MRGGGSPLPLSASFTEITTNLSRNRDLRLCHLKGAPQQAISLSHNVVNDTTNIDIRLHPHPRRLSLTDQLPRSRDKSVDKHRAGKHSVLAREQPLAVV